MDDRAIELLSEYNRAREQKTTDQFKQAWYFCKNKNDADELAELTVKGIKRGTASLYFLYEHEGEQLPQADDYNIITDYEGVPKCVIRTRQVDIVPFKDVPAAFAFTEGEGDKSLMYWREAHKQFFTEELREKNVQFSEDIEIVCEVFEVVLIC